MRFKWTEDKIMILKEYYPKRDYETLICLLGGNINMDSIRHKAMQLGITVDAYRFSEKEIKFMKDNFYNMPYSEISKKLNRNLHSIQQWLNDNNYIKSEKWSNEELILLEEVYPYYSNEYLKEKYFPNREIYTIRGKALKIGLHKSEEKRNKNWCKEELLEMLGDLAEKLERTPLGSELSIYGLPSSTTYLRYFGGYPNACELIGLQTETFIFGSSNIVYSINGDQCFSKSEKIITDFFIENNVEYIKEYFYKDLTNDYRCKNKRMDWLLNNETIVEFFGMPEKSYYQERMEEKKLICRDNNLTLLELYKQDLKSLNEIFKDFIN